MVGESRALCCIQVLQVTVRVYLLVTVDRLLRLLITIVDEKKSFPGVS